MISGNAEQLIQAVVEKYATCRTYRDSGMAFSRDFVIEFETYYVRPDRFSFRWRSENFTDEKHIHFEDNVKDFDYIYDIFSHEAVTKGRFDKFVQSAANKKGTDTLDKRFVQSLDEWRTYLAKNIALNNKKINE